MFHHTGLYLHAVTETTLRVDTSRGETLRINVMTSFNSKSLIASDYILNLSFLFLPNIEKLSVPHFF